MCVCVCVFVCVCVCVCEGHRKRVCVCERKKEKEVCVCASFLQGISDLRKHQSVRPALLKHPPTTKNAKRILAQRRINRETKRAEQDEGCMG